MRGNLALPPTSGSSSSFRRAKSSPKPAMRSDILIFLATVVSGGKPVGMITYGCNSLWVSSALSRPPNPTDAILCRYPAMRSGSNRSGCTKQATACERYEIIRRKFDELTPASGYGDIDSGRDRHR